METDSGQGLAVEVIVADRTQQQITGGNIVNSISKIKSNTVL